MRFAWQQSFCRAGIGSSAPSFVPIPGCRQPDMYIEKESEPMCTLFGLLADMYIEKESEPMCTLFGLLADMYIEKESEPMWTLFGLLVWESARHPAKNCTGAYLRLKVCEGHLRCTPSPDSATEGSQAKMS